MSKVPLLTVSSVDNSLINNINTNSTTITTAFDNTLSRNGASPNQMQSTLDMNSNPIINIPFASSSNQPVALGQVTPNTTFIPVLSGDVSSGSFNGTTLSTTIQPGVVTGSKIASNTITNSNIVSATITGSSIASNTVSNTNLTQMAANTVKGNPTGSTANVQDVTPATARSSSLLNVEGLTFIGDANYNILITDRTVAENTSFTTTRTWTLPNVSSMNVGQTIMILNFGITSSNNLILNTTSSQIIHHPIFGNQTSLTFTNQVSLMVVACSNFWELILINQTFTATLPGIVPASGGGTVNFLRADGTWVQPTVATTPTVQRFTSGTSQTYTPTAGTIFIKVRMCGGGGGGGAQNTNNGQTGSTSSFGSWTTIGGSGGILGGSGSDGGAGGTGGATGTGTPIARFSGGSGSAGGVGASSSSVMSGAGGNNPFGGAGGGRVTNNTGISASANTGGGGGGAGSGGGSGAGGGGAGEYVEFFVNSPSSTTYTVGAGGAGGVAGGQAGGAGAAGIIIIEEYPF